MQTFYMGHWIPEYAAQFLIVLAGFALMFQAHRIARTLFLLVMGSLFMPVILQILQPLAWEAAQQAPTAITSEITRSIGAPEWAQGIVGALVSVVAVYYGVCYRLAGYRALGIREGYLRANDGIVAGGAGAFPAGVPLPADRLAIQTGRPAALDLQGPEDSSSLPPPRF